MLSSHDDYSIQSARSIDRGGRSILEHLNILDVGGIKSGYCRTDKGDSITRSQLVEREMH